MTIQAASPSLGSGVGGVGGGGGKGDVCLTGILNRFIIAMTHRCSNNFVMALPNTHLFFLRLSPCEGLCFSFSLQRSPSESDESLSDSLDDEDDDEDEGAEDDESDCTPVGSSMCTLSAISVISGLSFCNEKQYTSGIKRRTILSIILQCFYFNLFDHGTFTLTRFQISTVFWP